MSNDKDSPAVELEEQISQFSDKISQDQKRGSKATYDLIPEWALPFIPPLYATEKQENPIVWIKLFLPETNWTWLITKPYGHSQNPFVIVWRSGP